MNCKIRVLDEIVANKIAAGEVVERPAAVVKELLENSIDAGASKIEIEIQESGCKLIKVTDNGFGMIKEDAILSLERHATSKIRNADDLFAITTLGFRGEALSSIAAVSTLELTTRMEEQLAGSYIKVIGGDMKEIQEIGCPVGTSISVSNLFFNTPARLKYLKSAATEMGHILDVVNHLSLAYPHIAFRLTHNGRTSLFSTGSANLQEVILNIYGKQTAKEMILVNAASFAMQIKGLIGKPILARGNRSHIIFFVNGRYIRNRTISRAVEDAYKTFLPIHKYPIVILNLTINPDEIDVNVHPTKTEIRFSKEKDLYLLVFQTISQALKTNILIPQVQVEEKGEVKENKFLPLELDLQVEKKAEKIQNKEEIKEAFTSYPSNSLVSKTIVETREKEIIPLPTKKLPIMNIIGQLRRTFILAEGEDGLFILDQHAAHERILYEQFKASRQKREIISQSLLIPIMLELTTKERAVWCELEKILSEVGFLIENFGGNSYLIREIPSFAKDKDVLPLIREIIDYFLQTGQEKEKNHWQEKALITMSCRMAIKAGDNLDKREMQELLAMLENTGNPYTCPHGRPTLLDFSWLQLEENFKRR